MANIVPFAFKGELASGTHNFSSGGDSFKIALYTANPYTTSSTVFTSTSEVSSAGSSNYPSGGKALTSQTVTATTATTASTAYSSGVANEVSGAGYTTGGNTLTSPVVANQSNVATLTFAQTQFTSATFGAAYAVIYNNSASDKLVVVLDFGGTKSCSNGTFTITFPSTSSGTPAGTDSLISITS